MASLRITTRTGKAIDFDTNFDVAKSIAEHHTKGGVFFSCCNGIGMSIDYENILAIQFDAISQPTKTAIASEQKPVLGTDAKAKSDAADNIKDVMSAAPDDKDIEALANEINSVVPATKKKKKYHMNREYNDKDVLNQKERDDLAQEMLAAAGEPVDDIHPKAVYKIECKCGTEYFCKLYADADSANCKECGERVFFDKNAELQLDKYGQPAKIMTNRYYVNREE